MLQFNYLSRKKPLELLGDLLDKNLLFLKENNYSKNLQPV